MSKTITISEETYENIKDRLGEDKDECEISDNYVIVRTYLAGVFAGILEKKEGKEVTLTNARRLWYWDGAASLSQLAMEGVSKPENCKFPCEVDRIILTDVTEIIQTTKKAQRSIKKVKVWKA
jgi:predicted CopG family antitoxin